MLSRGRSDYTRDLLFDSIVQLDGGTCQASPAQSSMMMRNPNTCLPNDILPRRFLYSGRDWLGSGNRLVSVCMFCRPCVPDEEMKVISPSRIDGKMAQPGRRPAIMPGGN